MGQWTGCGGKLEDPSQIRATETSQLFICTHTEALSARDAHY
jgi:hypothetical protein